MVDLLVCQCVENVMDSEDGEVHVEGFAVVT